MARWFAIRVGVGMLALGQTAAVLAGTAQQWWIAAGVFRTDGAAEARLRTLTEHGVADGRVVDALMAGAALHRVVVGPYADRAAARAHLAAVRGVVADAFPLALDSAVQESAASPTPLPVGAEPATGPAASIVRAPAPLPAMDAAPPAPVRSAPAPASAPAAVLTTPAAMMDRADMPQGGIGGAGMGGTSIDSPGTDQAGMANANLRRGISLREYLRRNGGNTPTSPDTAPPDYQLNRLHRNADGSAPATGANEVQDVTPAVPQAAADSSPRTSAALARFATKAPCALRRWFRALFSGVS